MSMSWPPVISHLADRESRIKIALSRLVSKAVLTQSCRAFRPDRRHRRLRRRSRLGSRSVRGE
jgi:hypothetical protein